MVAHLISIMDNSSANHVLHHCDRTRSAEARRTLQFELWDPLRFHGIHLTSSCILASENDVLLLQELAKTNLSPQLWQCSLCSKLFRSEHFLDRHLSRKHAYLRSKSATVCLADLCSSIIPCFPVARSSQGPVSTALLMAIDSSSATTRVPEPQHSYPFCHDVAARRRLERACEHVLNDCITSAVHSETQASLQKHLVRLQQRLCQRVVDVECTPKTISFHARDNQIEPQHTYNFPVILASLIVFAIVAITFACLASLHHGIHRISPKIVRHRVVSDAHYTSVTRRAPVRRRFK